MRSRILWLALFASATLHAQPSAGSSRGQLLYSNHCVECHGSQMHWRAQRLARDWASLKFQVRRWQEEARLGWTEDDIDAVARHLNDTIYQYPQTPQARR